jgi:hypothetical protein
MEPVVEHRREVARYALHPARADRLDARLLDRLEHGTGLLPARHQPAMHRRIVAREPQRHRIGMAADDRRLARGQLARRLGQPRLAGSEPRPLGRKSDLELRPLGDGSQAARDRALERLGRSLSRRSFALGVGAHGGCSAAGEPFSSARH